MPILGLSLLKDEFYYVVMKGTIEKPELLEKTKEATISSSDVSAFLNWYQSKFISLIETIKPTKICCYLGLINSFSRSLTKETVITKAYPYGVLNLLAFDKQITIINLESRNITNKQLKLDKSVNKYDYCDVLFNKRPPYWNDSMKAVILSTWSCL